MSTKDFVAIFESNPIIAAVKDEKGLQAALKCQSDVIFVLFGNICNIASIITRIHHAGKHAMINIDLIDGMSNKEIVVDFIKNSANADGIISTKAPILRAAKNRGLFTIHRFFLIDSLSYHSLPKQFNSSQADIVEIMPGIMPKMLDWVRRYVDAPLIASGLVCDKEDVMNALGAGALAISSTSQDVWNA